MTSRWLSGGLAALACAFAVASCDSETIVLATIPSDDAGALVPTRCVKSSDCGEGSYCEKGTCDAPAGTCRTPEEDCGNEEAVVCGCDGVTYFNECLRKQASIEGSTAGPCTIPNCGGSFPQCTSPTVCFQVVAMGQPCAPSPNASPPVGTCWFLPADCPQPSATSQYWDDCAPDGARCEETCPAIKGGSAGSLYHRSQDCTQPQP